MPPVRRMGGDGLHLAKARTTRPSTANSERLDNTEITEAGQSPESGAERFTGRHGGAAKADAVAFEIACLKRAKQLLAAHATAEASVSAPRAVYPNLRDKAELDDPAKTPLQTAKRIPRK